MVEVIAAYWRHCQTYYARPDDSDSNGELSCIRLALGVVKRLYADTQAADFGPLSLKAVREEMVRLGWARNHVNTQTSRVRRMFRWAVENEMVPPAVLQALQAVSGLRKGKTKARETKKVRSVADEVVDAVKPFVARQIWAMVDLQRLTGMRPGEVVRMRGCDIDLDADAPVYRPARHKTEAHGMDRNVYLGPKAKAIIESFVRQDPQAYLFSPAEAEQERRAKLSAGRKTPLSCGNRPGTNKRKRPRHKPGSRYTVTAYLRAIYNGCDKAFPPPTPLAKATDEANEEWRDRLTPEQKQHLATWRRQHRFHPNQLRHTAATRLRKKHGLDVIQAVLGHRLLTTTRSTPNWTRPRPWPQWLRPAERQNGVPHIAVFEAADQREWPKSARARGGFWTPDSSPRAGRPPLPPCRPNNIREKERACSSMHSNKPCHNAPSTLTGRRATSSCACRR
jgi:integrase